MYELGEFVGNGFMCSFFRIREDPTVGVKVFRNVSEDKNIELLNRELEVANTLMKLDMPIPKYVGIVEVHVPEYYDKTILKIKERNIDNKSKYIWAVNSYGKLNYTDDKNRIICGMLIEYIESDASMISPERIKYIYEKEVNRMKSYGIRPTDTNPKKVLWSKSKGKMYFIDILTWDLSKLHRSMQEDKLKKKVFLSQLANMFRI